MLINGVTRLDEHFTLYRSKRYFGAAECHYPFDGIGSGSEGRWSGKDLCLKPLLGMIQQGKHESCAVAKVTKDGAFPEPGACGQCVHRQSR